MMVAFVEILCIVMALSKKQRRSQLPSYFRVTSLCCSHLILLSSSFHSYQEAHLFNNQQIAFGSECLETPEL